VTAPQSTELAAKERNELQDGATQSQPTVDRHPATLKSWSLPLRDSYAAMTIAIAAIADSHPDCCWIPIQIAGLHRASEISSDAPRPDHLRRSTTPP
jgi:hypothetical protein